MKKIISVIFILAGFHVYAEAPPGWKESAEIKSILSFAEQDAGLPIGLAHCVAYTESRFNPKARSKLVDNYRSCGLMQIYRKYIVALVARYSSHPDTFLWDDPQDSAEVGCRYLAYLIDYFGGSVYLAVLSYNAGPTTVRNMKSMDDIPPRCRKYADNIMKLLDEYQETW